MLTLPTRTELLQAWRQCGMQETGLTPSIIHNLSLMSNLVSDVLLALCLTMLVEIYNSSLGLGF